MTFLQKISITAAVAATLFFIIRKAMAYARDSREQRLPTLQAVPDALPMQDEPLNSNDLRVAQNAPL